MLYLPYQFKCNLIQKHPHRNTQNIWPNIWSLRVQCSWRIKLATTSAFSKTSHSKITFKEFLNISYSWLLHFKPIFYETRKPTSFNDFADTSLNKALHTFILIKSVRSWNNRWAMACHSEKYKNLKRKLSFTEDRPFG